MHIKKVINCGVLALLAFSITTAMAKDGVHHSYDSTKNDQSVQLGPRPFFLVNEMVDSDLKKELLGCSSGPFQKTDFSIGHRGAAMQFPEHTKESYEAAARMGAGIIECDVTFTKDRELVCRHAQNDLHTTTNILLTPLAKKCTKPFTPATLDASGKVITPASAECRTSDITLAEFKTLRGKMDASDRSATTVEAFVGGTPDFRTDLYTGPTSGTLMTHKESIALFKKLGVKMTPELKDISVEMPFDSDDDGDADYTEADYAQQMINEYKEAGVNPSNVWPQSFDIRAIRYWVQHDPSFGKQAVYLDDANTVAELPTAAELVSYKAEGINVVAPPLFALLTTNANNEIVPSQYAKNAKAAGLDMIAWTLERSGILADGNNGFYYQTFDNAVTNEGDTMVVLDVLAKQIGILGIFSDWPATVTYYANCMGLK
jgi:glycerophosphoryl diester phosphodiesterase